MTLLDRARNALRGVRPRAETEGQRVTAQETGVMLGLMGEAQSAGAGMTDEQRLLLIQAMPGMRARETVLLSIPNRSTIEENELHMIRREMAVLEGRPVLEVRKDGGWSPKRFLGPIAASPLIAILASPLTWVAVGVAAFGIQTARLNNAKGDLAEARRDMAQAIEERDGWKERAELYSQAVTDARRLATETADALEAERQRAARAAARERRRQREIQDVLTGGDPPAWSLRDDEPVPPGPATDN